MQLTGSRAGFGITKIQIKHPDVTRADVMSIPRIMREYEPVVADRADHSGRTWIVKRDDGKSLVVGEAKTPDGGMLATAYLADSTERPLFSRRGKRPSGKSPDGSTPQRFSAVPADTGGGVLSPPSRSRQDEIIIVREGEDVNRIMATTKAARAHPDFRTEAPDDTPPFNPKSYGDSPSGGMSPEEAGVAEMAAQGLLDERDMRELAFAADDETRINTLREHALAVAECVMRIRT
jgi:hypothetical protein